MNPPSAIHGAMGRERKPFTYTPGGLDLSEIKSERMAKRLMRNAMNQGVPELPPQTAQSPTTPNNPMAVPNFNCLPVQVFPSFALPANPKSLLRTRSTPDQARDPPVQRVPQLQQTTQNTNNYKLSGVQQQKETNSYNDSGIFSQVNNRNNDKPSPMYYDHNTPKENSAETNYGSTAYTSLPGISYDAEYFQTAQKNENFEDYNAPVQINTIKIPTTYDFGNSATDFTIQPVETNFTHVPADIKIEDNATDIDDEQREVKVVKKQVKKKVETNGDQNGDASSEADMTVKLPTKKSAAKTETKVEVVQKVLPDGSIEEIKTTTTRTTVDGKTEIKTKTETTIIPKEEEEEEEIEYEEEEEEENVEENGEEVAEEPTQVVIKKTVQETPAVTETNKTDSIVKKEERSETTTTTKKVVVVQNDDIQQEDEEEQEVTEQVVIKKPVQKQEVEEVQEVVITQKEEHKQQQEIEKVKTEEKVEEVVEEIKKDAPKVETSKQEEEEEVEEEEEEFEEAEEPEEKLEPEPEQKVDPIKETKEEAEESEYTEEEIESEKEEAKPVPAVEPKETEKEESKPELPKPEAPKEEPKPEEKTEQVAPTPAPAPAVEQKVPLREPSIPLEKVEDVEIKPIGPAHETITKSHTETTEIITNKEPAPGTLSTQTEYNRIENIVTVNRTTKTLDRSYEQLTQQGIPTVKTYFPPDRERMGAVPQPAKPYQPVYAPSSQQQQQPERRHSLLLERLSMERQAPPTDIYQNNYQYNNQGYEQQRQWSQEPQSEVINVSNVKPSTITNQEWYQQTRKENVLYNNISPISPGIPNQQWSQTQPQSQPQIQSQSQYQSSFSEKQDASRTSSSVYQQQNSYPGYTLKPSNWATNNISSNIPSVNTQPNQYSYLNKDTSEAYQNTSQQYSSSYVPPPWEQDPSYAAPELSKQIFYQPQATPEAFSPSPKPGWKPSPPTPKFTKPAPLAYVPPAPNQSFVKATPNIAEPPKLPGRKTYYSEYERRYISVPESMYVPGETKFQPQPDPSPQYYYDNNEPNEKVEHEWRKELREFTEKTTTQTQQQFDQNSGSVRPPWEEDTKYAKVPTVTYTPTPSWSQTLRPQSYRERSFESEFVGSQEWSKTNTLGRSRPLSSYGNSNIDSNVTERTRGVSVDRYNPNSYQSPIPDSEHGPVQTHTLNPGIGKGYHNPSVPGYHARASAEPREHLTPVPEQRHYKEAPVQSRSFKYLQWITGTDD